MQDKRLVTLDALAPSDARALRGFVPLVREVAALALSRTRLKRRINRRRARIRRVLRDAQLDLAGAVTDLLGVSARAVLTGIVEGEADVALLAARASGRLKLSDERLAATLQGDVREHHRVQLRIELEQVAALEETSRRVEARLGVQLCRLLTMCPIAANHNALRSRPDR
jgi:hypothetical protein